MVDCRRAATMRREGSATRLLANRSIVGVSQQGDDEQLPKQLPLVDVYRAPRTFLDAHGLGLLRLWSCCYWISQFTRIVRISEILRRLSRPPLRFSPKCHRNAATAMFYPAVCIGLAALHCSAGPAYDPFVRANAFPATYLPARSRGAKLSRAQREPHACLPMALTEQG